MIFNELPTILYMILCKFIFNRIGSLILSMFYHHPLLHSYLPAKCIICSIFSYFHCPTDEDPTGSKRLDKIKLQYYKKFKKLRLCSLIILYMIKSE